MQLIPRFIFLIVFIPFLSAQANNVGLSTEFIDAGSIFEGPSVESAELVCSGVLVACDTVLTAAHCLKYRHAAENRFWLFFQHMGVHEVDHEEIIFFCDDNHCPGQSEKYYDLALLRLISPSNRQSMVPKAKTTFESHEVVTRFLGFGIRLPWLDNHNLKRLTSIQLRDCDSPSPDAQIFCSDLDNDVPTPCHKDSGGPLYAVLKGGEQSLLGIAIRTGVGCRSGQAVYNDITSPIVQSWLRNRIGEKANQCSKITRSAAEIISEPEGWLDETSSVWELKFNVTSDLDQLLVTMNHAPGANLGGMHNDFDLELSSPANDSASLLIYCDNTWKLLSVCRVPSPAPGTWKARVIRKHGEGHFQLVATGITK